MTTVSNCKMIDALMYGMMPSAKMENCSSAPPENRLTIPNMVFFAAWKKSASALPSIPGVGNRDAHAIHGQHRKGEEQAATQLRDAPGVLETFNHG